MLIYMKYISSSYIYASLEHIFVYLKTSVLNLKIHLLVLLFV
jgi:hypothetical protein